MAKHVLSVLVHNHIGVLSRVSGLFSRRGYNIESLTVGTTEDENYSRMTIVSDCDQEIMTQITRQLDKLEDVVKIYECSTEDSIYRELGIIKVKTTNENRAEIINIANIFRSNIIDVTENTLVIQVVGDHGKVSALITMLKPYGVKEVIQTGITAIERGDAELKNK